MRCAPPFLRFAGLLLVGGLWVAAPAAAQTAPHTAAKTVKRAPVAPSRQSKPTAAGKAAAPTAAKPATVVLTPTERKAAEGRARQMTTNLQGALSLSPQQTARVLQINTGAVEQLEVARRKYAKQPAQLRQELDAVDLGRLSMLKDVLSSTQFQRYVAMRAQKMGVPAEVASPTPGTE